MSGVMDHERGAGTSAPIRRTASAVLSRHTEQWGDIRVELIRRDAHDGAEDRFLLPWHSFGMKFSGQQKPGLVTRLGGGTPIHRARDLRVGEIVFLPAGVESVTRSRGATCIEYMVVCVPVGMAEALQPELDGAGTLELRPTLNLDSAVARALMQGLRAEITQGQPRGRLFVEAAATLLLAEAARQGARPTAEPARGGLAPWQLKRVTDHIAAHIAEDLSLQELARLVGLSPHHFCRVFKLSTGLPPHRWQTIRRIERTQDLLLRTDMPLAAIALAVGFSDQSHFTTVFRKTVGATPHSWRRAHRP